MKDKKPFYKNWWFIGVVAFFLVGTLGIIFESDETKQARKDEEIAAQQKKEERALERQRKKDERKEERQRKKEEKEREKEEKEQMEKDKEKALEEQRKKEEEEKIKEKERLANRSIDEVLQEDDKNVDKAALENGVLTLEKESGTIWSENSLFFSVYDLFESAKVAFGDDSIDEVNAIVNTLMVDTKGNESIEPAISFTYTRDSFEELNYDNFSNMAYSQQWRILNESDSYSIHPGIYKNLKDDYTSNLSYGTSKVR